MLRNDFLNMEAITSASIRIPHFENPVKTHAFGRPGFEKTSIGHFYSDSHKMAAPKRPMLDMCHTEDHDGFSDHLISTYVDEYGEVND